MQQPVKFDGVAMTMGGRDWIVPALSLGQVKRLSPQIQALSNASEDLDAASLEPALKIVQAALSRNYPEVTLEQVEDMLDLKNFRAVIDAVMGVSGLVKSGEA